MYVHNYSGKHFTLYVKNNFRIVLFYSCVLYILLYIYISSLKNPLKLASKRLAKCLYCQSFIFKKIYDPPPWGHPIAVGPGAAWSKLTPLHLHAAFDRQPSSTLTNWSKCYYKFKPYIIKNYLKSESMQQHIVYQDMIVWKLIRNHCIMFLSDRVYVTLCTVMVIELYYVFV